MEIKINEVEGQARIDFLAAEHPVLTLKAAKDLVGRKIRWTYKGYYANAAHVLDSVIGEIISKYDFAKRFPKEGYESMAAYWEEKLPETASSAQKELYIIDAEGFYTGIFCEEDGTFFDEPTFVCTDSDREVSFDVI